MKILPDHSGEIFAVAIATGKSASGNDYANILVSRDDKPAKRSAYSVFLDVNDEEQLAALGITDIEALKNDDGSRKVTPLAQAVSLGEGKLGTVQHAPYGMYKAGSNKPTFYSTTSIVVFGTDSLAAAADRAVSRAYERADCFARGEQFLADYRKYVVFAMERDELERLLVGAEEVEE